MHWQIYEGIPQCKVCALGILNDLYYFEPEVSGYDDITAEKLKSFVLEKLAPYSDENIEF